MKENVEFYHLYHCKAKVEAYDVQPGDEDWRRIENLQEIDVYCYVVADNKNGYGVADLVHAVFYKGVKLSPGGQIAERVIHIVQITYKYEVVAVRGLLPSPEEMILVAPVELEKDDKDSAPSAPNLEEVVKQHSRSIER